MEQKDLYFKKIREIISDSENSYIETKRSKNSKPIKYNQRETIERINLYLADKFLEREDGFFFNIITPRIPHFTKLISPDTKDFMPYGIGTYNMCQSWILRKKTKEFFDKTSFYRTLNDSAEGLSTYGSALWKRVYREDGKKELQEVNLLNVYFDQTTEWIKDTDVVEKHFLSRNKLWEKMDVWDNVAQLIKQDKKEYEIQEFWGYIEENNKNVFKHCFVSLVDELVLWEEKVDVKDFPYYDFHLGRYKGRWMRVGVPERLFKIQERTNELVNQNAQTTAIASLLLLKSGTPDVSGNVLTQAENGQIISDATLEQVGIANTGLNAFIQEMTLLNQQADKLCLTPEILQGESSPSNTTFRGIAVVNAGAVTAFKNYRQDFFEKIANILVEDIMPDFVKDWKHEDIIDMLEDELDMEEYKKALQREMEKEVLLDGIVITNEVRNDILTTIEDNIKNTRKSIKVDNDDFWNFEFGFKLMPTDESVDKTAKNDAYFNALQMTGANPALTTIDGFKQYLEDNGIKPWSLTQKQVEQMTMSQGGANQMPEPKQPDKLLSEAKQLK